jgi:hypothetical protein
LPFPATLRLRFVHIDGVVAHLVRPEEAEDTAAQAAAAFGLGIADLTIREGRLAMRVAREGRLRHVVLSPLAARASLAAGPSGVRLSIASLEATPRGVSLEPITAALTLRAPSGGGIDVSSFALAFGATRIAGAGTVDAGGRVDLRVDADPLGQTALAPLIRDLVLPTGSRAGVVVRGPRSALAVSGQADLRAAGRISVRARVDASGSTAAYRAALDVDDVVPGVLRAEWPSEPLDGTLRGSGRGTQLRAHGQLAAPSLDMAFAGRAAFGDAAFTRLRARGNVRDLARLGGPAGRFPFHLDAEGSGPLPRPSRARGEVALGPGTVAGMSITQASARGHLDGALLRIQELRIDANGLRMAADGRADVDRGTVEAKLDVLAADRGTAAATVALARERGAWGGTLRSLDLAPQGLSPWTTEAPAAVAFRDGFKITDLRLRSGEQRAVVSATMGRGGTLGGSIALADVQLAPFCTLAATSCAGIGNGRLEIAGRLAAPQLSLTASARELAAGPIARSTLDASLRWETGRASGKVTIASLGGSVVIAGSAPVPLPGLPAGSDALDLTVTARDLAVTRVAQWAPRVVRSATGTVRADLRLGGTWNAPRPQGVLELRAPVLELVASGARWEDVVVDLRADGERGLAIERLVAAGGRGGVTGTGRFEFDDGIVPSADVRLAFDHFLAVDRPVLEAAINGHMRVAGRLTAPTVRGRLYVAEGAVRPAFLPATNAPAERDPTIEVVGLPEEVTEGSAPSMGDLTLALTITLGNDMRIRRRDANVQLGGTLQLRRTPPGALTVRGTVKVEKGWYTFSGRRFTMRSGEVRFDGGPVDGAQLDLEAMYRTGEYDVTVAVQGTIGKPELLLSSDPPLDEPDVLAVLLVGRPSGELSDAERMNVQAEAASLAMGYVVPGLSGGLGEVLPLEQVEVGPEQVRVSQHVGNDVFISLSQQFIGWAGQTMAVEYNITRHLSVELSTSSRGSGALDFFWRRRY